MSPGGNDRPAAACGGGAADGGRGAAPPGTGAGDPAWSGARTGFAASGVPGFAPARSDATAASAPAGEAPPEAAFRLSRPSACGLASAAGGGGSWRGAAGTGAVLAVDGSASADAAAGAVFARLAAGFANGPPVATAFDEAAGPVGADVAAVPAAGFAEGPGTGGLPGPGPPGGAGATASARVTCPSKSPPLRSAPGFTAGAGPGPAGDEIGTGGVIAIAATGCHCRHSSKRQANACASVSGPCRTAPGSCCRAMDAEAAGTAGRHRPARPGKSRAVAGRRRLARFLPWVRQPPGHSAPAPNWKDPPCRSSVR